VLDSDLGLAPVRRALLSVTDKSGVVAFARVLRDFGVEVLSTGGTARMLREAGLEVLEVERFTGFPEMLDGRVKTLHPKVHAGILYRRDDPGQRATMEFHGLVGIDLVAVNLYAFEEAVRRGAGWHQAIEEIDIGGPALLRSAAKNHAHVTVASSPRHYAEVLGEMREHAGATSFGLRLRLAGEAFATTSAYDAAVRAFFARSLAPAGASASQDARPSVLPERLEVSLPLSSRLRYGENPHQEGAVYGAYFDRYEKLWGREISYNNILDVEAAVGAVRRPARRGPAAAIIKHSNPCGVAVGPALAEAWRLAVATDPQSASGGIIALSRDVDVETAEAIGEHFVEVLVAPGFEPAALDRLRAKKNRILLRGAAAVWQGGSEGVLLRSIPGGFLAQSPDDLELRPQDLRVVTSRQPRGEELEAMLLAWDVVQSVKSNAVVYASAVRTLGIGAGQMSRVDAARFGALKAQAAGHDLRGCAVASDAFFPFADGIHVAADAGASAVIQTGGSIRDEEVIAAANERGLAMAFTGIRHFRH
jgi:phosphoribosylaminoimidazolecarboxamide formyltransferase/IMP cyclohydrolase